jgi:PAS domain S-box-containing protein
MGSVLPALETFDQAKEVLEKTFECCPDALLISDPNGRILLCNPQTETIFGYNRLELVGQSVEVLLPERFRRIHPSHRSAYNSQPRMRAMGAGLELYGRRKDGSEFPVDIMLNSVQTGQGPLVLSVIRDVTQQKKAQEDLHLTQQRFRLLIENARDYAIFLMDASGHVVTWNSGAERLKGYRSDEIVGCSFSCFYTPDDVQRGKPEEALRIAAAEGHVESEGWRVRKDGSRFWANVVISRIDDEKGNLYGFATITRDFTDRKQVEQELKKQATLLEVAHDSIIVRDTESRITFWNRGAEEKYGWTRAEALGKVTHSFLHTQFPQPFAEVERELHEHHYWEGELVHTTKGGNQITVASRQVLQIDARGNPTAIFEINNDITDRKHAEQALKRSEERLRTLFEFSPDAIITSNSEGIITQVNSQVEQFFGYQRDELVGQSVDELVRSDFARVIRHIAGITTPIHAPAPWGPAWNCWAGGRTAANSRSTSCSLRLRVPRAVWC